MLFTKSSEDEEVVEVEKGRHREGEKKWGKEEIEGQEKDEEKEMYINKTKKERRIKRKEEVKVNAEGEREGRPTERRGEGNVDIQDEEEGTDQEEGRR